MAHPHVLSDRQAPAVPGAAYGGADAGRGAGAGRPACAALFIGAPGSGHGKTTVTAALARLHVQQGRRVRVFKTGPDFLDPMVHRRASGQAAYQLDLWLGGEAHCRQLVADAARQSDLILIEGVMGLFDGEPCSADLAQLLGVPVLAVIDATGVAQTLGAIAAGLARYRPGLRFAGVLANRVATARHEEMIRQGIPEGIPYFGGLRRSSDMALPGRHLGLVQANEIGDLDARLASATRQIAATQLARLPAKIEFDEPAPEPAARLLGGVRIGIALDAAFSFLYLANVDLLRQMGAELVFFSPLTDRQLPAVHSLYLPGGYPELHLSELQANAAMQTAIREHFEQGRPIYAECGGMLYLMESLSDQAGRQARMVGLLPGHATMHARLKGLGYQTAPLPGGELRGHTFHYSVVDIALAPVAVGRRLFDTSAGERIFQRERLVASYLHCYFASNPVAAARLFMP